MLLGPLSRAAACSKQATSASHSRLVVPRASPALLRRIPLYNTPLRVGVKTRAEPPSKEPPPQEQKEGHDARLDAKVDSLVEELKSMGMTKGKANEILRAWSSVGVRDAEQLRKLLVQKSMAPLPSLSLQAVADAVASLGGFYLAMVAKDTPGFPFRIGVELVGDFLGIYYAIQVFAEMSVIGALLYTSYKYGTSAAELLAAVQEMAGPKSGLSVADKAAQAVNVFKVVQALEAVAEVLREKYGETGTTSSSSQDTLRNLGAYLTMTQARDTLGFRPENYGLSDQEASNIAYAFAVYDTNQNFKLEPSELGALCSSLGKRLEGNEVEEALKLLDTDKNGYIDFKEFVAWWVKQTKPSQALRQNNEAQAQ